ncbi:MAG: hypothetical protein GF370_02585 [Candidatus Nealsonbacteria bacterium]|nr:hypothetical protein [Candidatus Nealsonbacteria bacterium]
MTKNIPKIDFRYSSVYDKKWRRGEAGRKKEGKEYPPKKRILDFVEKAEKEWRKDEKRVFSKISNLLELPWREEHIYCYVVGRCRPFPFPLTVPFFEEVRDFTDVLTHELIHRFFVPEETKKKVRKAWKYSNKKYKRETRVTRMHILVYAIHSAIYLDLFGEERIQRNIKRAHRPGYKRAWEIVQKEGYEQIIQQFTQKIE